MVKPIYTKTVLAIDAEGNKLRLQFDDKDEQRCIQRAETSYKLLSLVEGVRVRYERVVKPKVKSEA